MTIKILGTGCMKCKTLANNVEKAIENCNVEATVIKVTDLNDIMEYEVMMTPALVINEIVIAAGKVLSPKEIEKYLK